MDIKRIKIIISLLIILLLGFCVALLLWLYQSKPEDKISVSEDGRGVLQTDEYFRFNYNGQSIKMKNFMKTPVRDLEDGTLYIADTTDYGIFFKKDTSQFYISIFSQPIEVFRDIAEKQLLMLLDINIEDACRLPINLNGPLQVDDRFALEDNFGLSFCSNGKAFSQDESTTNFR